MSGLVFTQVRWSVRETFYRKFIIEYAYCQNMQGILLTITVQNGRGRGSSPNWISPLCSVSLRSERDPGQARSHLLHLEDFASTWMGGLADQVCKAQPTMQSQQAFCSHTPPEKQVKYLHWDTVRPRLRIKGRWLTTWTCQWCLAWAEDGYRRQNAQIYTFSAEKIKELSVRWMLLLGLCAELGQHFAVTSAKIQVKKIRNQ